MQKYRSFAGFRHHVIIEVEYYLGMPIEDASEFTTLNRYLRADRELREFCDYRDYGSKPIMYLPISRQKQAP